MRFRFTVTVDVEVPPGADENAIAARIESWLREASPALSRAPSTPGAPVYRSWQIHAVPEWERWAG